MNKYDLSIIIPARHEMFLVNTVDSLVKNIRGNTEIIVVLDGEWADPPLPDNKLVKIIYNPVSLGQRAATNQAARLAGGKWIMKLDAHCAVDEGFDVKVIDGVQEDWTVVPVMYNHHAFDWVCSACQHRKYQAPTQKECEKCHAKGTMRREMVWKPRLSRRNEFYRFDTTLHFQYHSARKKEIPAHVMFAESLSLQGSCFVITKKKYWELDICEEAFGSWGQQGVEVALKTWLSGGKVMVNRKTWYSHMFRTQGGDFGFPYPLSGSQVDHARKYSKKLFFENTWDKQIYPLSWLLDRFKPLPDWHSPEGSEVLTQITKKGIEFYKKKLQTFNTPMNIKPTKGIVFFTDNQVNLKLAHKVQNQLRSIGLPIVSVSLKKMEHFGNNVHLSLLRGYLTMFKQILAGIEASKSDIIYLCEHDVLYPKEHFDFTPPANDKFYYDVHWWKVRNTDGFGVSWEAAQVSGCVADRELLLEHYRRRVAIVEKYGYNHSMGYEPGSHNYPDTVKTRDRNKIPPDIYIDDVCFETFKAAVPYVDVRTDKNLSHSKWSLDDFRDKATAKNFRTGHIRDIPGWSFGEHIY